MNAELITLRPTDCLIVTDTTKTFMPGGGLAVTDGDKVIAPTRTLVDLFRRAGAKVIALIDVHPRGHISLASSYINQQPGIITLMQVINGEVQLAAHALFTRDELIEELGALPKQQMRLWPDHGIFGSGEENVHPDLLDIIFDIIFPKGMNPRVDSFSGFRDNRWMKTYLGALLRSLGITRVFVTGLAFDYCVGFTAEDGIYEGFESFIIRDATASVDFPAQGDWPGSVAVMEKRLANAGVEIITSDRLEAA